MSLRKEKKKGGLGHHSVIVGFFSHVVIDTALALISTDLGQWNLLEL